MTVNQNTLWHVGEKFLQCETQRAAARLGDDATRRIGEWPKILPSSEAKNLRAGRVLLMKNRYSSAPYAALRARAPAAAASWRRE